QGDVLQSQLAYWRQQLAGTPAALELPTDRPRPPLQTFAGASLPLALPAALTERLRALRRRPAATLFMTRPACCQALPCPCSGADDVVVGTPIGNRTWAETAGLVGFFVNALAMRADLSRNPSFTELLGRVREGCLGAYAHQDLPFERLVEELRLPRDLSRTPLFQVMFALHNASLPAPAAGDLQLELLPAGD